MPKGHAWMPPVLRAVSSKSAILDILTQIDNSPQAKARIFALEAGFRTYITAHIATLIKSDSSFAKFNTNPFVLMIFTLKNQYTRISQIEGDILPAKLFSSMETSAGKMVEAVVLPVYGWATVPSAMHTPNSALDSIVVQGSSLLAATLKSGPRCLNDEMAENFADGIIQHAPHWMASNNATSLNFTYGVLYGTKRQSNKKDWHIIRNLYDKLPKDSFEVTPEGRWECAFTLNRMPVTATVRIGSEWWAYLGGSTCLLEVCVAIVRACVVPGPGDPIGHIYVIKDLQSIVSIPTSHAGYNVGLLQQNQIPWLFMLLKHFYDDLLP